MDEILGLGLISNNASTELRMAGGIGGFQYCEMTIFVLSAFI